MTTKRLVLVLVLFIYTSGVFFQTDMFFQIKYENILKQKKIVNLSNIASNVEYIKLETNKQCLLNEYNRYFFISDMILVHSGSHILKFSYTGKFLGKILSVGRGPGEIDPAANISFIPDKRLIAIQNFTRKELLYFNLDGELVRKVNYDPDCGSIIVLNDGKYLIYNFEFEHITRFTFRLSNENNDTLSVVKNHTVNSKSKILVNLNHSNFTRWQLSGKEVYFKSLYNNDTVYSISSNKIIPLYFIDLGKFKIPDNLIPENLAGTDKMRDFKSQADKFCYADVIDEFGKIFLATFSFGNVAPKYFLIDKVTRKGNLLVNNSGESTGIINDWDGGADFWPVGSNINDKQLYMPLDILTFKKDLDKSITNKKTVLFPDQQKKLTKLISVSDPLDNPIIMIITLKTKK